MDQANRLRIHRDVHRERRGRIAIDLDGLTGVDVVDESPDSMDASSDQMETREAVGRRREKNAA